MPKTGTPPIQTPHGAILAAEAMANKLALRPIQHSVANSKWRTEAQRSHASPRLLYFTKGQGRITVAGLTSGYGPNNLIFIPAHTMYGYEANNSVFGFVLTIPPAMASEWPKETVHLRLKDVLGQKEMVSHFDALERELKSQKEGHNRAAHYMLGMLSVFFERQLKDHPPTEAMARSRTSQARLVAAYTDLVERDYGSGKNVSDYAADLGVTATHLTRCCNHTCGKPALAILHDRIFYEARLRLRETKTPVQNIAKDLGFASAAYFTRSFLAETGHTPSNFRKLAQA